MAADKEFAALICVSGSVDPQIQALVGGASYVDAFVYAVSDTLNDIARTSGLQKQVKPLVVNAETFADCATSNQASGIVFNITAGSTDFAYQIDVSARSGPLTETFQVGRPTGMRDDVAPLTGGTQANYVTQSIGMDIKSLGIRAARFFMRETRP